MLEQRNKTATSYLLGWPSDLSVGQKPLCASILCLEGVHSKWVGQEIIVGIVAIWKANTHTHSYVWKSDGMREKKVSFLIRFLFCLKYRKKDSFLGPKVV